MEKGPPAVRIAPSLLACDFARLGDEVSRAQDAGADWLHVDVMDGHFVPNLTVGPPIVRAIRRHAKVPLDVHLMIADPLRYARAFADAGADGCTFHAEAVADPRPVIDEFRRLGRRVGMSVNPDTPIDRIRPFVDGLDLVLVMSVMPGFGGQSFREEVLPKLKTVRESWRWRGDLEIDGGIDPATAPRAAAAGANVLVAGTALFGRPDLGAAIAEMRAAAAGAVARA